MPPTTVKCRTPVRAGVGGSRMQVGKLVMAGQVRGSRPVAEVVGAAIRWTSLLRVACIETLAHRIPRT